MKNIKKAFLTLLAFSALIFNVESVNAEQTITVGEEGTYTDFNALFSAVQNGEVSLESGDTIQLTSDLTMSSAVEIPSGYKLNLDMNGKKITAEGFAGRPFLIGTGADVTVYGNGTVNSVDSYGAFDVYGTLTIKDGTYRGKGFSAGESGGGATLRTRPGSTLIIEDGVYVYSETSGAVYAEGYLDAGACEIVSHSHNGLKDDFNNYLWSYCVHALGDAEFNGTVVSGVQGGLYAGSDVTINGGNYTAAELTDGSYTGNKAFYGLYISNDADVIINDGTFSGGGASSGYCVLNGDNDTGMPLSDRIIINNGTFNGKVASGNNMNGFTIYGGSYADCGSADAALLNCIPAGYELVFSNGRYVVKKAEATQLPQAKEFVETSNSGKNHAGYYFDVVRSISAVTERADITVSSSTENRTMSKTLILPKMSGEGGVSISILVLNAPSDITGTIEFE